ncbi:hypothetical protein BSPWISOXPB_4353 [uncultured Gammaproteobacteria bacterium]|nr:hypothetical protein BSPWISOXPB_4353 [uncultured Gammaproteobacteria bacterium]
MKEFTTKVVVKKGNEYIKFRIECLIFSFSRVIFSGAFQMETTTRR